MDVELEVMIEQEMHATLQVAEHATCKTDFEGIEPAT